MKKIKVLSIFGARPEAVKMAPLVLKLREYDEIDSFVCTTAQHREMLDQVLNVFGIKPDYDLNLMKKGQTLNYIAATVIAELDEILSNLNPDIVLVHGDTATSYAAAVAAFNRHIKVGHVEAGLRSFNKWSPYPEEVYRQITSRIADLHFAPTKQNEAHLKNEGVTENVYVTGNTAIDVLYSIVREGYEFRSESLKEIDLNSGRTILMTAHRRENLGVPHENIFRAVRRIVDDNPDVQVVYPVHKNPAVIEPAERILGGHERIYLTEPLDVDDMQNLMNRCYLVLTDSGGLQEEAPALGKPVVVLRTETERPEAVEMGTVVIAGVEEDAVYTVTNKLLRDKNEYEKMSRAVNPYGDGKACERICGLIVEYFKNK